MQWHTQRTRCVLHNFGERNVIHKMADGFSRRTINVDTLPESVLWRRILDDNRLLVERFGEFLDILEKIRFAAHIDKDIAIIAYRNGITQLESDSIELAVPITSVHQRDKADIFVFFAICIRTNFAINAIIYIFNTAWEFANHRTFILFKIIWDFIYNRIINNDRHLFLRRFLNANQIMLTLIQVVNQQFPFMTFVVQVVKNAFCQSKKFSWRKSAYFKCSRMAIVYFAWFSVKQMSLEYTIVAKIVVIQKDFISFLTEKPSPETAMKNLRSTRLQ